MDSALRPVVTHQATAPAFSQRCKRVRHRQNGCRICVEVCPEGAIALAPGPVVDDRCIRCGLCQTACPTEAFEGEVHPDQQLLRRVQGSPPQPDRDGTSRRTRVVHCREAEPQSGGSVAVPCLGSVTENFLLGAAASGTGNLTLVRGDCASCRLKAGEALFAKAHAAFLTLAPTVGLSASAVKVEQRPRRAAPTPPRRKFLARVAGRMDRRTENWPAPGIDPAGPLRNAGTPPAGPTSGRSLLQVLLREASWSVAPSLPCNADLPWARVKIDQRDCATCGTCVNVCPTGAITRQVENGRLSHHFRAGLCVNCRLCEEACPQQVISFASGLDARDLVREEARALTDIRLHACEICGETLPEREGRFCLTCQRRGRVDPHLRGTTAAP